MTLVQAGIGWGTFNRGGRGHLRLFEAADFLEGIGQEQDRELLGWLQDVRQKRRTSEKPILFSKKCPAVCAKKMIYM